MKELARLPLAGRSAVITGVSRRQGIGYAVAQRLLMMGANVFIQHWSAHDEQQPWGADSINELLDQLRGHLVESAKLENLSLDLADAQAPQALIQAASDCFGMVDILICNHAKSGDDGPLEDMTAMRLDAHWQVNTRSTLLATQAFAKQHDGREGGRVIWMTSGQNLGPMRSEIAYATSKAALAGMTQTVADALADRNISLNTVNPGPVNTGYLDPTTADRPDEVLRMIKQRFPQGRFGEPDDPARLIAWLVSDEGRWVVGQVINTEGGFRRW